MILSSSQLQSSIAAPQKRSQLSFSASLSAKLAVLQLFTDAHGLFLPADVARAVWKWDCVLHLSFGLIFAERVSPCRGCYPHVGHEALHKCCRYSHMQIPPPWDWSSISVVQLKRHISEMANRKKQLYVYILFGAVFTSATGVSQKDHCFIYCEFVFMSVITWLAGLKLRN